MTPKLSTEAAAEFALAPGIVKPGLTFPGVGHVEWATLTLARARRLHAAGIRALVKKTETPAATKPSARARKKKPK